MIEHSQGCWDKICGRRELKYARGMQGMGRLLAMLAATALVSACAATAPEGKLDPAEAEAAINERLKKKSGALRRELEQLKDSSKKEIEQA